MKKKCFVTSGSICRIMFFPSMSYILYFHKEVGKAQKNMKLSKIFPKSIDGVIWLPPLPNNVKSPQRFYIISKKRLIFFEIIRKKQFYKCNVEISLHVTHQYCGIIAGCQLARKIRT